MNRFNVKSEFMPHPFYSYELPKCKGLGYECVSISRIDFDKNTDILLKANNLIKNKQNHIYLFGAENRIYVHHKLKDYNISEYWKGKFPKKTKEYVRKIFNNQVASGYDNHLVLIDKHQSVILDFANLRGRRILPHLYLLRHQTHLNNMVGDQNHKR